MAPKKRDSFRNTFKYEVKKRLKPYLHFIILGYFPHVKSRELYVIFNIFSFVTNDKSSFLYGTYLKGVGISWLLFVLNAHHKTLHSN